MITLPFDIGQEVFYITEASPEIKCPFCNGAREIVGADGTNAFCPRCNGFGTVCGKYEGWMVNPKTDTVESYEVYGNENANIAVCLVRELDVELEYIFATREEAQAECDKRNAK